MFIDVFNSPYIVPVAGCAMVLGIVAFGTYSDVEQKRLRSQERMALLSKGMSIDDVQKLMATPGFDEDEVSDPIRSLSNARRAATVLLAVGFGIVAFGLLLATILQIRPVLIVAAAGLIPICIGLGFLADYRLQMRELNQFGIEPTGNLPRR